ncbi:MAG: hypothetical protein AMXMBFR34_49310 [Myxococcaceae bacterium]
MSLHVRRIAGPLVVCAVAALLALGGCQCGGTAPTNDGGMGGGGGGTDGGTGGGTGGGSGGGGGGGGAGTCGDSTVTLPAEECDDGNTLAGDGCSATCTVEVNSGLCGNNRLEASNNEECDDGNQAPGDGCGPTCQLEAVGGTCGDGTQQSSERCDDTNTAAGDGCNPTCNLTNTTSLFVGVPGMAGYVDGDAGVGLIGGSGTLTADNTYLYFGDTTNHVVRRIEVATARIETLAGDGTAAYLDSAAGATAQFQNPDAITTDGATLWVIDSRRIRAVSLTPPYAVTTIAGSGAMGCMDATGAAATFDDPRGLTYFRNALYLVDANCAVVRKIDLASQAVTTLAGAAYQTGRVDGVGAAARFISPRYIASDNSGVLYISDTNGNQVRSFTIASNAVGTFIGSGTQGYLDGVGTQAQVHRPRGMTSDGTSLYWVEFNQQTVRQAVFATASATTLAGQHCDGGPCTGGYAEGVGTQAQFTGLWSITWHPPSGSLFVNDSGNRVIRRIR